MDGITSLAVMLKIYNAVAEVNAMLLQKGVDLGASVITKQVPQLTRGEHVFAIGFQSDGLQGGALEAMPGSGQESGKLLRQVQDDLAHGNSIGQTAARCTRKRKAAPARGAHKGRRRKAQ